MSDKPSAAAITIDPEDAQRRLDDWDAAERLWRARLKGVLVAAIVGSVTTVFVRRLTQVDAGGLAWSSYAFFLVLGVTVMWSGRARWLTEESDLLAGPSQNMAKAILRMCATPDDELMRRPVAGEVLAAAEERDRTAARVERWQPHTIFLFLLAMGIFHFAYLSDAYPQMLVSLAVMVLSAAAYCGIIKAQSRVWDTVILLHGNVSAFAERYGVEL